MLLLVLAVLDWGFGVLDQVGDISEIVIAQSVQHALADLVPLLQVLQLLVPFFVSSV